MSYSLPSWDLFDNSNTFYENRPLGKAWLFKLSPVFWVPPSVTNISCTVVIKLTTSHYGAVSSSQNASTVCSTNLFAIAVPHFYLINRHDGATSIMANSLICTLREYISQPTGPRLRPLFKDSIQGLSPTGTIISLATTRIPEFGDEMEGPHTGYQALSTDATSSPTMQTGGTLFDPNQEIMSMASVSSSNSAKLADFTRVWQTLLQPSRHFFLIFQIDSFPPSDLIFRITPSTNGLMASQHPMWVMAIFESLSYFQCSITIWSIFLPQIYTSSKCRLFWIILWKPTSYRSRTEFYATANERRGVTQGSTAFPKLQELACYGSPTRFGSNQPSRFWWWCNDSKFLSKRNSGDFTLFQLGTNLLL